MEGLNKQQQLYLLDTGLNVQLLNRQHDDQIPYSTANQIDLIISNMKFYAKLLRGGQIPTAEIQLFKNKLIEQLGVLDSEGLHTTLIQKFEFIVENRQEEPRDQLGETGNKQWDGDYKIEQFGQILKQLIDIKANIESEEQFIKTQRIIQGFIKQMQVIIQQDNYTVSRLETYDPYANNIDKSAVSNDRSVIELQPTHYWKQQKIIFKSYLSPEVFTWVEPPLHRVYLSEVTKVYHEIVPFKIKYICLNSLEEPKIETSNYFKSDNEPQKSLIIYCKPGTNILYSYRMDDICKALTIQKEYLMERQLPIQWKFSLHTKTVITPEGRIFGINCKTSSARIDSSMYEILQEKVSNRGRRPTPRYDSGFIYANRALYVIGGNTLTENVSNKNYKYSLKDKKWTEIAEANVATRKPTVCVFRDRYLVKLGGINQFDYINKIMQIYDTETDRWSIVRASPKNVLEEIEILENSLAVQIGQDQIYVFSGKNANNYQKDTGFVLQIMEIRQKPKKPIKVSAELWNVTIGKKNIYSFFGLFSTSNVITHNNCLYTMRVQCSKSLPY